MRRLKNVVKRYLLKFRDLGEGKGSKLGSLAIKLKLDVWYVDNWSLWLDVKIIAMTVMKVLRRDGISQAGHTTAAEFMGYNSCKKDRK